MPSRLMTPMPFDSCVRDRSCPRESTTHVRASRRRSYHNVLGRVTTFQNAAIRKHDDAWARKVSSETRSFHALSLFHRMSSKRVCKHYGSRAWQALFRGKSNRDQIRTALRLRIRLKHLDLRDQLPKDTMRFGPVQSTCESFKFFEK